MAFWTLISPAWVMFAGAVLLGIFGSNMKVRHMLVLGTPVLVLCHVWMLASKATPSQVIYEVASFELLPVTMHDYTLIFATIFSIAAFAGGLFGLLQSKRIELVSAFIYAGSAIGVTFSGDLISLFIYWELMALGSTLVIMVSNHEHAKAAALRYAYMHLLGGVLLMVGIIAYMTLYDTAAISAFIADTHALFDFHLTDLHTIAMWLMLLGILVNAAAPPFSAWLPDAYPVSSPFGAVFLSAFTTKTAVFVLLTLFAGTQMLVWVGAFMIFYGIIMAILENDMRRILAYSVINQVGFMITGIGIGTELALHGVAAHAFCHIIYKALLFMSAGSVLFMTGKSRCSDLGGLYHSMKLTAVCGIIGALAISAFPLTSGFVSKSLITSAAANQHMQVIWFLLVAASAGVFLHAGIKFPWFVFFQKDSGMRPEEPPLNMRLAMLFFAALCIIPAIPGVAEHTLYAMLPQPEHYEAYTYGHVVTQLQLLLFSGLAFFAMLPLLKRTETISLDVDWMYRKLVPCVVSCLILRPYSMLATPVALVAKRLVGWSQAGIFAMYHPQSVMLRSWSIGLSALWVAVLLCGWLLFHYL